MTNNVLKSAVVVDNYKVYYTFQKKKDSDNLNAMGNFYRFSYQQKQIQNFLESYFIKNGKPKVGDKIYNDTQPAKIEIIAITIVTSITPKPSSPSLEGTIESISGLLFCIKVSLYRSQL